MNFGGIALALAVPWGGATMTGSLSPSLDLQLAAPDAWARPPLQAEDFPSSSARSLPESKSRRWRRVIAWSLAGGGTAMAVAGGVMVASAQSDYDALSGEVRFVPSTTSAVEATAQRDDAQGQSTAGQVLVWSGLGLAVVGVIWGLVEAR